MELSSCSCKTLLLAILIVDSQFLHGLGCFTETESPGATRDGAKQLGNGEGKALRLFLRSRSAQTHEAAQAQRGRCQGAAPRPSGTSGASSFPAVIPPSNAGGFGPRQREDGQTFVQPAFESVKRLGLARKLLKGVDTDASSNPSCRSNYVGCSP